MKRRDFLGATAASMALFSPRLARPQNQRVLKFVPQADLAAVDPMWTTAYEWHIIPDAGTAAAALQSGEVDWWEQPIFDIAQRGLQR